MWWYINAYSREFAPKSKKIFYCCTLANFFALVITVYELVWQPIAIMIVVNYFSFLAIKLFNRNWLHRYRIELGCEAARVEASEMLEEYERDYQKDKYISQRLLSAQQLEQVCDAIGQIIYMTGRYRGQQLLDELYDQYDELEESFNDVSEKLEHAEATTKEATEEATKQNNLRIKLEKELEEVRKELIAAKKERDQAIRQYEIEVVGFAISDEIKEQEKLAEAKEQFDKVPDELAHATNLKVEDFLNEREEVAAEGTTEKPGVLSERQIKDIIFKLNNGYKQTEVAKLYNVNQSYISKLKKKYAAA